MLEDELEAIKSIFGDSIERLQVQELSDTKRRIDFSLPLLTSTEKLCFSLSTDLSGECILDEAKLIVRSTAISSRTIAEASDAALTTFRNLDGKDAIYASYQAAIDVLNDQSSNSGESRTCTTNGKTTTKNVVKLIDAQQSAEEDSILTTSVILLDHMHSIRRYHGNLSKWTVDLNMSGLLLTTRVGTNTDASGKAMIILQTRHDEDSIGEFVKLLRTSNVDIDSRGKPCKERMASTLFTCRIRATEPLVAIGPRDECMQVYELKSITEAPAFLRSAFVFRSDEVASLIESHW
jgi:hypothetical protein